MTSDAQNLLQALKDYLVPAAGPAASGLIGFLAGRRLTHATAGKIDAEADQIALNTITESFRRLIDSYERRIDDLTAEVTALRAEIKGLRTEILRGTGNV